MRAASGWNLHRTAVLRFSSLYLVKPCRRLWGERPRSRLDASSWLRLIGVCLRLINVSQPGFASARIIRYNNPELHSKEKLELEREHLKLGGGAQRIEKQHESGKLTARERVTLLADRESFQEAGLFARHNGKFFGMNDKVLPADGVVTG